MNATTIARRWLDNDSDMYLWSRREANRIYKTETEGWHAALIALEDALRIYIENRMPEMEGLWADLLRMAFEDIDFAGLAAHLMAETRRVNLESAAKRREDDSNV